MDAADAAEGAAPADLADSDARVARAAGADRTGTTDCREATEALEGTGVITIVYDPAVKPFLAAIRASNKGARSPVYQESPVGPLW